VRLHKTGHPIADTVSDLIGDLPDGDYEIAYGILRHNLFGNPSGLWFEVDKGFWGSSHYDGNYRLSFRGTQPIYDPHGPHEPHGLPLKPWKQNTGPSLICPPTQHVCEFFGINPTEWLLKSIADAKGPFTVRHKGCESPVDWGKVGKVITFNSTIAVQALIEGVPVISDPIHSTVGSYTYIIKNIDSDSRGKLLSFMQAHQFRLDEKGKICRIIEYYLSTSGGMREKP